MTFVLLKVNLSNMKHNTSPEKFEIYLFCGLKISDGELSIHCEDIVEVGKTEVLPLYFWDKSM